MVFCLTDEGIKKLKKAIKEGKINPNKLLAMTSAERRAFLAKFLTSEQAKMVNLEFEKKLLLKNREKAIVDWARSITGLTKQQKLETAQKIKEAYAEKRRRKFDPQGEEKFLNELTADIYAKKYRAEVTLEEAQRITELGQEVMRAEEVARDKMVDGKWKSEADRMKYGIDYGSKKVALDNYTNSLERESEKAYLDIKEEGLPRTLTKIGGISANFIAENARSLKASFDNSLWGRQGIKVLYTHPKIWIRSFVRSFKDMSQTIVGGRAKGDAIINAVKTDIYSRENFLNGRYELGQKLDVGISEEEFPTSLPERIPVLGRAFKTSEVAYEAGAMRLRVDLADKFYDMAENTGLDMTSKEEIGQINNFVNSMTGRGKGFLGLTEGEAGKTVNKMFFSIKFFKSNLDVLLKLGSKSKFVRKQAAINLFKMIASIGVILAIAKSLGAEVEKDSTSADFGKIKKGNTRFDVTGGQSSLVVLASRLLQNKLKSSITGNKKTLGEGFGVPTAVDILWNFIENKFSPVMTQLKEIVSRKTFEGDKPNAVSILKGLTIPIVLEGAADTKKIEGTWMALLTLIADGLGISANTYEAKK